MKKFKSSRNIIIALIVTIVVVLLISFSAAQRDDKMKSLPGQSEVNGVIGKIDRVLAVPFKGIEGSVRGIGNLFSTYAENNRLKKQIDYNKALEAQVANYKIENDKLKTQLDLNETLSNYDVINASVINRSPDSWQDVLTIDKGSKDGIEANMSVMGDKGLIGRVIIADKSSSKIELLTTVNQNTNHFPVMMKAKGEKEAYGLMEKYNSKTHTLTVNQLTTIEGVEVGNQVTTSGLGNNSPKGLLIGEVKEIRKSKTGLDDEVLLTPAADMYDVTTVTVVKRLAGAGSDE